jgi:hypothetical protein
MITGIYIFDDLCLILNFKGKLGPTDRYCLPLECDRDCMHVGLYVVYQHAYCKMHIVYCICREFTDHLHELHHQT